MVPPTRTLFRAGRTPGRLGRADQVEVSLESQRHTQRQLRQQQIKKEIYDEMDE